MLVFAVTLAIHDEAPSTDFFDPPVVPVSPFVNYSRMAPMTIRSTASRNFSSGCSKPFGSRFPSSCPTSPAGRETFPVEGCGASLRPKSVGTKITRACLPFGEPVGRTYYPRWQTRVIGWSCKEAIGDSARRASRSLAASYAMQSATSIGGTLTGRGADLIIIDDPLKPQVRRQCLVCRSCDWLRFVDLMSSIHLFSALSGPFR